MVEKKSLGDIGMMYDVSRTAIYKKLKSYDIKQRSKSEARTEAQRQGKLPQQFFDILYKNAQDSLFLDRKYRRFLEGLKKGNSFEGGIKDG